MEAIFVPLIVFSFVALIVKMSLDYNKWKKMHQDGDGAISKGTHDKSLGVSELRNLIQEAVENANLPLMERISHLEHQLGDESVLLGRRKEVKKLNEPAPDHES